MREELPRKGNSRYKGPEAGRCLEWEDQGRESTTMAEAKKQGQGGKEMQVGRRRDQRLNVILKCPRNTKALCRRVGVIGVKVSRFQIIAWLLSGFRRVSV